MRKDNPKLTFDELYEKVCTYIKKDSERKLISKAYLFAFEKHFGQKRLSGEDYIVHPLNVAYILSDINADAATICAAILHDTIEDCDVTEEDLLEAGLSKHIVDAIVLLTRSHDEDYMEYVKKVALNPLAKEVKLADLQHNMDLRRLSTLKERDLVRNRKYQIAYHYLINTK